MAGVAARSRCVHPPLAYAPSCPSKNPAAWSKHRLTNPTFVGIDALSVAHLMRTAWFRQAYIKSESCYRTRLLLTHRRNLKANILDLENAIRAAVADDPLSAELMDASTYCRGRRQTDR